MLIREKARTIKLIRQVLNRRTMRQRQMVLGAFRRADGPSEALLATLTVSERKSLNQWLVSERKRDEYARQSTVVRNAHKTLTEVVEALDVAADSLSPSEADVIWQDIRAIAHALRKADHPRPRSTHAGAAVAPGQVDLIDMLTKAAECDQHTA
ncbi:hypothetical protein [Burkholderia sp. MBR-1]|uniref:hypothetical protein n=1 Tax=Burkholderia sp. MBR-1 TaxID=2732364 RepID=UPI0015EF95AB|nr:hypothetical protein [Burkholderia sp. MBR-1]QMI49805.1 hypothetical protein MBR110_30510 [Burkholderia sp. MBR-1]